jgi:glycyl-tRNA synthetase beta chain
LPPELLITTMREHQRYFTVVDAQGRLLPRFVTISNTPVTDPSVVQRGNERVLRARLADAMFFWNEDRKVKLESRLEALKNVVYQARLGTSYEKVMRFRELALHWRSSWPPTWRRWWIGPPCWPSATWKRAWFSSSPNCRASWDANTLLLEGENPRVARAIHEHYLPTQAGGRLPSDDVGALVSIADKIDTLCGCFGVGLIPTGTADPFALRRSAIGILQIMLDREYRFSLRELVDRSVALLAGKLNRSAEEVAAEVLEFIRLRFLHLLTGQGFPQDVVDAVLAVSADDPVDALRRIQALDALRQEADFEPLAVAFKRVVNIIKGGLDQTVAVTLFEAPCEQALLTALQDVEQGFRQAVAGGDYARALRTVATLRGPVDALFDGVMVMAPEQRVRDNRLALLTSVARLFQGIADFARIAA